MSDAPASTLKAGVIGMYHHVQFSATGEMHAIVNVRQAIEPTQLMSLLGGLLKARLCAENILK